MVIARARRVFAVLLCSGCFSDPGPPGEGMDTESESGATSGPSSTTPGTDPTATSMSSGMSTGTTDDDTGTNTSITSDSTDDPSSEVTGAACPPTMVCLDTAPPNWAGPFAVVVRDGDVEPECPAEWPEPLNVVHGELDAGPAECNCLCAPPSGTCTAAVGLYIDDECEMQDDEQPTEGEGCTYTGGADALILASVATNILPGPCTSAVEAEIPVLTWGVSARLCARATEPAVCEGDGLCVPTAEDLCISREGDHTCPDGSYTTRRVFSQGAMDTRDCSGCTCGTPVAALCAGSSHLDLFESFDCSGGAVGSLDIAVCGEAYGSARFVPESLGSCTAEVDTMPVGEAIPGNPFTLCCTD